MPLEYRASLSYMSRSTILLPIVMLLRLVFISMVSGFIGYFPPLWPSGSFSFSGSVLGTRGMVPFRDA